MTLNEIMPRFLNGEKIRREVWVSDLYLQVNYDGIQAKLFSDKGNHNIQLLSVNETFTLEDIISTDWDFFNVNQ